MPYKASKYWGDIAVLRDYFVQDFCSITHFILVLLSEIFRNREERVGPGFAIRLPETLLDAVDAMEEIAAIDT